MDSPVKNFFDKLATVGFELVSRFQEQLTSNSSNATEPSKPTSLISEKAELEFGARYVPLDNSKFQSLLAELRNHTWDVIFQLPNINFRVYSQSQVLMSLLLNESGQAVTHVLYETPEYGVEVKIDTEYPNIHSDPHTRNLLITIFPKKPDVNCISKLAEIDTYLQLKLSAELIEQQLQTYLAQVNDLSSIKNFLQAKYRSSRYAELRSLLVKKGYSTNTLNNPFSAVGSVLPFGKYFSTSDYKTVDTKDTRNLSFRSSRKEFVIETQKDGNFIIHLTNGQGQTVSFGGDFDCDDAQWQVILQTASFRAN